MSILTKLCSVLDNLLDKLKGQKDGLLLILDDSTVLQGIRLLVKKHGDEISISEQQIPLCILVVGLEDRRQELVAKQPSLARVFELIDISPWSDEEATEFYQHAFQSANAKIEKAELDTLVHFTGGLPVLAHEIGDAVWRATQSLVINAQEIDEGIFNAAEIIGLKLLEPQIFSAIQSERYRSILRKMAGDPQDADVRIGDTVDKSRGQSHGQRRMKTLGAIDTDPDVHGGYKFPNLLHALYFFIESQRAKGGK